jgi:hypothetical protein
VFMSVMKMHIYTMQQKTPKNENLKKFVPRTINGTPLSRGTNTRENQAFDQSRPRSTRQHPGYFCFHWRSAKSMNTPQSSGVMECLPGRM